MSIYQRATVVADGEPNEGKARNRFIALRGLLDSPNYSPKTEKAYT